MTADAVVAILEAELAAGAALAAGIDVIGPECAVPLDAPCRNLAALAAEAKRFARQGNGQSACARW